MSEDELLSRRGCSGAEAGLLWAVARHGGDAALLDGLTTESREALVTVVDELEELDAAKRRQTARKWAERDSRVGRELGDHLLREDEVSLDGLMTMSAEQFESLVRRFGCFQFTPLVWSFDRRKQARVMSQVSGRHRKLIAEALKWEREMPEREERRLSEVYVTLSRHYDSMAERLDRLGLYSVAQAAGARYRDRVEALTSTLDDELGSRLDRYHRLILRSSRRGLGADFRASLTESMRWWKEVFGDG